MGPDSAARGPQEQGVTRRSVLKGLGAGALATGGGGILSACSSGTKTAQVAASTSTITLGYVAPFTGSLAGFASADRFVIETRGSSERRCGGETISTGRRLVIGGGVLPRLAG